MRSATKILTLFAWVVLIPAAAYAQGSITGVVRDTSGAVLPGVTVEASSPVLLEKVRTAVTDGSGQYRITELLPGTYTVAFSLAGFSTVKREGVELTGSFVATINADMRVGAVEETITVTGESPIVDVQSTTRQRVLDSETIAALPSGRNSFALGVLVAGVGMAGGLAQQDVGGSIGPETRSLVTHGGRLADQRLMMNGLSLSTMIGGGWGGGTIPNPAGLQEMVFDTSGVTAELATGGVRTNFILKEGGNSFSGTIFGTFANEDFDSNNLTPELTARGLPTPGSIKNNWDVNPGFGGPLKRDKIWFFASGRSQGANTYAPGMFYSKNANNPNVWTYEADLSRPAILYRKWQDYQFRATWQAHPKHKIGFMYDFQSNCFCPNGVNATTAPEASNDRRFPSQRPVLVDWTSPMTSRLLLEASAIHRVERWGNMHLQTRGNDVLPTMIGVLEQGGQIPNLTYRAATGGNTPPFNNSWNVTFHWRLAISYITGSHAIKFGLNDAWGFNDNLVYATNPFSYRFNNGIPNQITVRATPYQTRTNVERDLGLYVQDKWTVGRLTLSGGLRYDHFKSGFPEQRLEPGPLTPSRNRVFPEQHGFISWHDITPKSGLAYDLFGNGKTALKVSLNKYLAGYGSTGLPANGNPVNLLANTTTRLWDDANRNYVPDCDLANPAANGECDRMADPAFGSLRVGDTFDPDFVKGWGKRDFNWEFSTGVQHEVLPRVSVDVSYFRRSYGNFQVIDNRAVGPEDFDTFSITVPTDSRLPNGGGYQLSGLVDLKSTSFGRPADNFQTLAKNYGKWSEHWDGVDFTANARLQNGITLQGGVSAGRRAIDWCEVAQKLPERMLVGTGQFTVFGVAQPGPAPAAAIPMQFCNHTEPFLTQVKGLAVYRIPAIDVQVAGTFQSLAGTLTLANYTLPSAVAAQTLGRPLSGIANLPVNILEPGERFGDRLNQLDLRFTKLFRFSGTRTSINFDFYNVLNASTILTYNNTFVPGVTTGAAWPRPASLLQARFFKIGAQVDF